MLFIRQMLSDVACPHPLVPDYERVVNGLGGCAWGGEEAGACRLSREGVWAGGSEGAAGAVSAAEVPALIERLNDRVPHENLTWILSDAPAFYHPALEIMGASKVSKRRF